MKSRVSPPSRRLTGRPDERTFLIVGGAETETKDFNWLMRQIDPDANCTLTNVISTNHDCGETNPLTFGLIARGLRSWTM